jgi:uncharacterized membrane protein YeaQ/YmgE (transglycosylase-associated protein family)
MPGRDPGGMILTIVLGIVDGVLGGWIGRSLGMYRPREPVGFIMAVVSAILILLIYRGIGTSKSRRSVKGRPDSESCTPPSRPPFSRASVVSCAFAAVRALYLLRRAIGLELHAQASNADRDVDSGGLRRFRH